MLTGKVIDVIEGGSLFLLLVKTEDNITQQVVEFRYMADIVVGEGLAHPSELVGREIEMAEDGMSVGFP